jgi:outer membrane protein
VPGKQRSAAAVKKIIALAAAVATMAGIWGYAGGAQAQQGQGGPAAQGQKIALIDMGYVFKNYAKFDALRKSLEAEIKQMAEQDKVEAEKIKKMQSDLQLLGKTHNQSSPEFQRAEQALADAVAKFQADHGLKERDLARKEADIFKTIYLEVADAVKLYVQYNPDVSMVLRFERDGVDGSSNPQEALQRMNRQVVYHAPEHDISDAIVKFLNKSYPARAAAAPSTGATNRR